ncbi:hypothetical protein NDU88_001240 [Pleurodeles waltl]|uniref:Uncharacterized protein n=1 Tax=Pleurodeles waltl TaxID=8319 RepID=A0AAV7P564_PLEWA|nr:hypothetical protein NDU88_001240 [Pleurodeles waltl]
MWAETWEAQHIPQQIASVPPRPGSGARSGAWSRPRLRRVLALVEEGANRSQQLPTRQRWGPAPIDSRRSCVPPPRTRPGRPAPSGPTMLCLGSLGPGRAWWAETAPDRRTAARRTDQCRGRTAEVPPSPRACRPRGDLDWETLAFCVGHRPRELTCSTGPAEA